MADGTGKRQQRKRECEFNKLIWDHNRLRDRAVREHALLTQLVRMHNLNLEDDTLWEEAKVLAE